MIAVLFYAEFQNRKGESVRVRDWLWRFCSKSQILNNACMRKLTTIRISRSLVPLVYCKRKGFHLHVTNQLWGLLLYCMLALRSPYPPLCPQAPSQSPPRPRSPTWRGCPSWGSRSSTSHPGPSEHAGTERHVTPHPSPITPYIKKNKTLLTTALSVSAELCSPHGRSLQDVSHH